MYFMISQYKNIIFFRRRGLNPPNRPSYIRHRLDGLGYPKKVIGKITKNRRSFRVGCLRRVQVGRSEWRADGRDDFLSLGVRTTYRTRVKSVETNHAIYRIVIRTVVGGKRKRKLCAAL